MLSKQTHFSFRFFFYIILEALDKFMFFPYKNHYVPYIINFFVTRNIHEMRKNVGILTKVVTLF